MTPAARATALAELAPGGTIRVALNTANAATVSIVGDMLDGPAPRLARALGEWTGLPVAMIRYASAGEVVAAGLAGDAWDVAFLAVDPARAAAFHFSPPYLSIEATAAVRSSSGLRTVDDLDRPGIRIASCTGAAYDLVLQRTLRSATRVPFDTPGDSLVGFQRERLDAVAGVRQTLEQALAGRDDLRLLDGAIATIDHALATPARHMLAAALLDDFVRQT